MTNYIDLRWDSRNTYDYNYYYILFDWILAALLKLLDIISAPNDMMIYMIKEEENKLDLI